MFVFTFIAVYFDKTRSSSEYFATTRRDDATEIIKWRNCIHVTTASNFVSEITNISFSLLPNCELRTSATFFYSVNKKRSGTRSTMNEQGGEENHHHRKATGSHHQVSLLIFWCRRCLCHLAKLEMRWPPPSESARRGEASREQRAEEICLLK